MNIALWLLYSFSGAMIPVALPRLTRVAALVVCSSDLVM